MTSDERKNQPAAIVSLPSGRAPVLPRKPQAPPSRARKHRRGLKHDQRVLLLALAAGLPGVLIALLLLWSGDLSAKAQWTLSLLIVGCWLGFAFALRERVVRPLQTVSNLIAALHEEDYSIRARGAATGPNDPLGELLAEVNALNFTLRAQKMGALAATALLRAVMAEIEVAVFAFDGEERLRLVNRAGERLLGKAAERLLGSHADELGLAECLRIERPATRHLSFPGASGRWGVRHGTFRENGVPHHLLVLTDLSQALREEERQAWQRIVRVLGHELNNSLTPIKSIAGSLAAIMSRTPRAEDWETDMQRGLEVISSRAESLSRFMSAYAQLAKLPQPAFRPVNIGDLLRRVIELERRIHITLLPGPELVVQADGDQLEQLLINLLRNAVDASLETGGGAQVSWTKRIGRLEIRIEDEGPGLSGTKNLFVPFFTTKPGGSGIGLVLSRQIAEAHGGSLTLENRKTGAGCEAKLTLPL
jgi:nitrogen fixation/metabolism regulation signal transduction histidine kinase